MKRKFCRWAAIATATVITLLTLWVNLRLQIVSGPYPQLMRKSMMRLEQRSTSHQYG